MVCNVPATCYPYVFLAGNILHKPPQALRPAWLTRYAGMQRNRHHLASFSVQTIESVFKILLVGRTVRANKPRKHVELPVIALSSR